MIKLTACGRFPQAFLLNVMKTTATHYLLFTLGLTLLICLAVITTWVLSIDNPYHVVLDVAVFLLAYGFYTAALLAIVRKFRPYPVGRFSMDLPEFTHWKLNTILTDLAEKTLGPFTTLFTQAAINALLGAHVGKQTAFGGVIRDLPFSISRIIALSGRIL